MTDDRLAPVITACFGLCLIGGEGGPAIGFGGAGLGIPVFLVVWMRFGSSAAEEGFTLRLEGGDETGALLLVSSARRGATALRGYCFIGKDGSFVIMMDGASWCEGPGVPHSWALATPQVVRRSWIFVTTPRG